MKSVQVPFKLKNRTFDQVFFLPRNSATFQLSSSSGCCNSPGKSLTFSDVEKMLLLLLLVLLMLLMLMVLLLLLLLLLVQLRSDEKNCLNRRQVERENLFEEIIQRQFDVDRSFHLETFSTSASVTISTK